MQPKRGVRDPLRPNRCNRGCRVRMVCARPLGGCPGGLATGGRVHQRPSLMRGVPPGPNSAGRPSRRQDAQLCEGSNLAEAPRGVFGPCTHEAPRSEREARNRQRTTGQEAGHHPDGGDQARCALPGPIGRTHRLPGAPRPPAGEKVRPAATGRPRGAQLVRSGADRPLRPPGAPEEEHRRCGDDHDEKNGPEHGETPSLAVRAKESGV
jgi:hypothetical protein